MKQRDSFSEWVREVYLAQYPSPPRNRSWRPPEDLGKWRHQGWERYEHSVAFTPNRLASYLLTQSSLQIVMDSGDRTEPELRTWIVEETAPFFESDTSAEFLFAGFVACHRR